MAKWTNLNDIWLNVEKVSSLNIVKQNLIDSLKFAVFVNHEFVIARFDEKKEAEKFIEDFIDEHYITTNKVE